MQQASVSTMIRAMDSNSKFFPQKCCFLLSLRNGASLFTLFYLALGAMCLMTLIFRVIPGLSILGLALVITSLLAAYALWSSNSMVFLAWIVLDIGVILGALGLYIYYVMTLVEREDLTQKEETNLVLIVSGIYLTPLGIFTLTLGFDKL